MEIYYAAHPVRYRVRIQSAALGESKAKADGTPGTPRVELSFAVLGFHEDGALVPVSGPNRMCFVYLTEATLGTPAEPKFSARLLQDLGFVGPSFSDLDPLVGQERDASCKIETNPENGEDGEKWTVWAQGRTPLKPVDNKGVRALDSKHKDLLRAFGQHRSGPAPAARPPARPTQAAPARPAANGTGAPREPVRVPDAQGDPSTDEPPADNFPGTGSEIPF